MSIRVVALVLLLTTTACAQQSPPADLPSMDPVVAADSVPSWYRPPPTAERWAPELHSPNGATYTPALTPDLRTAYVVRWDAPDYNDPTSIQELFVSHWDGDRWTRPERVQETAGWRVDFPHISPDGQRFLISYNRPHDGHYRYPDGRASDDFDLWEAQRLGDGPDGKPRWSPLRPITDQDVNRYKTPANARIGYVHNETSPRTDRDGVLYFWTERLDDGGGRRDVYRAEPDGAGGFLRPELLPFNTPRRESGVAVDPDGEWVIIASEGLGGEGESDLFVVARRDGGWGEPVNLGPSANSAAGEASPEVTADGQTLFFTTNRRVPGVADVDDGENVGPPSQVFWVDLRALEPFRRATGG